MKQVEGCTKHMYMYITNENKIKTHIPREIHVCYYWYAKSIIMSFGKKLPNTNLRLNVK